MRVLVLVFAVLFAAPAMAAPDSKAAAHYKQGKAFLAAKQYDQAIIEFEAAYAIDKVASHLFNIATAYDAKAEYDKAISYYQRYLDAEPTSKLAVQVRTLVVEATKKRDDAAAKKRAEEEAARLVAEKLKAEQEQAQKKIAATTRVKNAEAFVRAAAWVDAGDEFRAAFEIDGDPVHLLAAAEAYRKADLPKARDAYRAYLEKLPDATNAEVVRGKLAETTKAIEKAEADERALREKERKEREERDRRDALKLKGRERPPHVPFKRGWIVVGGALLLTGLVADFAAPNADNGVLDVSDFAGPALYGLATIAVLRGVF